MISARLSKAEVACAQALSFIKRRLLLECELTRQSTRCVHPPVHTSHGLDLSPTAGAGGGGRLAPAKGLVRWQLSHVFSLWKLVDTGRFSGHTGLYLAHHDLCA